MGKRQVFILERQWLFLLLLVELQLRNFKNLLMAQAMDLDTTTLVKDNQANKTSIITRLVMEQQGNLQVHKEAPAQGGQATNTGVILNLAPLNYGNKALEDCNRNEQRQFTKILTPNIV